MNNDIVTTGCRQVSQGIRICIKRAAEFGASSEDDRYWQGILTKDGLDGRCRLMSIKKDEKAMGVRRIN
ncbi:MAG: hypothetical protein ABIS36_04045 [Chryseolinea sp.]